MTHADEIKIELLTRARNYISRELETYVCYAVASVAVEMTRGAMPSSDRWSILQRAGEIQTYIADKLGDAPTLGTWQKTKGFPPRAVASDRIAWIDYMIVAIRSDVNFRVISAGCRPFTLTTRNIREVPA